MTDKPLYERIPATVTSVFERLNRRGINPGGRQSATLETWAPGVSADKTQLAPMAKVAGSDIELVVIDMRRAEVRRFNEQLGAVVPVGDARLEIARNQPDQTPLTLEQLNGDDLAPGQERRVLLGDTHYTVIRGGAEDPPEGFTWFLTLKRLEA